MRKWLNALICVSLLLSLLPPASAVRAATPTPTETAPTATPTAADPTATPSPTATQTAEPLGSETATQTPAATATATATASPSAYPETATATGTATVTATLVATPAITVTPTASVTATVTPTLELSDTVEISPTAGGTMRSTNKRVTVSFPPGATQRTVKGKVSLLDPSPYSPQGWQMVEVFDLKAWDAADQSTVTRFDKPVTITVSYAHIPGYALPQDSLTILYWNPDRKLWEKVPSTLDRVKKTITAQVDHFSSYAGSFTGDIQPRLPGVEDFQNDLFTGSANVSYPLEVPPGRGAG